MRARFLLVALAAGCATPAAPETPSLHTDEGRPIVVVVEMRDHRVAVTAELLHDPDETELHELRAPRVMADVDPALLTRPASTP